MLKIFKLKNLFLVPIFLTMVVSIVHVITWYNLANPISWAVFMSIAIEIGAMTSLIAATKKIKGGVWFMFGIVTFIQLIGNIFYTYANISETDVLFKQWIELTSPIFEYMGTESGDVVSHKRWLALLEGGLLPIISVTSLHFYTKYEDEVVLIDEDTKEKSLEVEDDLIDGVSEDDDIDVEPVTEQDNFMTTWKHKTPNPEPPNEVVSEVSGTTNNLYNNLMDVETKDEPDVEEDVIVSEDEIKNKLKYRSRLLDKKKEEDKVINTEEKKTYIETPKGRRVQISDDGKKTIIYPKRGE